MNNANWKKQTFTVSEIILIVYHLDFQENMHTLLSKAAEAEKLSVTRPWLTIARKGKKSKATIK